ncbi:MAG: hypothetical protein CMH39_04620 [Micrococcales bacterium]|nr:hypothetical protein [Micrococcales bacterium]MEC8405954.1 SHOCT domain-containing protein [Actinomycetota bacterium]MEC8648174.1 SHOCT domain-containing protein [Actinomycetota bacterium]MED5344575.1 SHOCT domain-containing protein [Actinomycetota bacterium]HBF27470.1 hypothetical protein [Actinomycetota bacterium]|tara:strand:+ start:345 stop:578 length:234 start_codon:yes stop_codon:yes gene_type:complete
MGIVRKAATAAAVSGAATRAHNRNTPSQPAAAPVPAAAPAAPADDTSAKLQELADLHAKGVLSDEEFAAAKAKALGI